VPGCSDADIPFRDHATVSGGLVACDGGQAVFAGDAIADPLTALLGALAAAAYLSVTSSCVIDVAMADVAVYRAAQPGGAEGTSADLQPNDRTWLGDAQPVCTDTLAEHVTRSASPHAAEVGILGAFSSLECHSRCTGH
jgi:hypothetical protein